MVEAIKAIGKGIEEKFNELMNRIGVVFASEPGFRNAMNYIRGCAKINVTTSGK